MYNQPLIAVKSPSRFVTVSRHLVALTMRAFAIVSLGATVVGTALAQSTFEPADFNATEALLKNGVDESILLNLEESLEGTLSKRTSSCSIAVCFAYPHVGCC